MKSSNINAAFKFNLNNLLVEFPVVKRIRREELYERKMNDLRLFFEAGRIKREKQINLECLNIFERGLG